MADLLNQLLEESASRHPEAPALWARGRRVTYFEIVEKSNQLANLLRDRGVKKADRIGLYFPKSEASVASMFGILKAGGAYVPLDPSQPAARAEYIIHQCLMKGLITDATRLKSLALSRLPSVEFLIVLDSAPPATGGSKIIPWNIMSNYPSGSSPDIPAHATDLAYILYTSGSTGRPKGVMLTHQNALAFVEWCSRTFRIGREDRLANHAPLHFDLSVFDLYNAIQAGGSTYLIPEEVLMFPASVAQFIAEHRITVWYSVPSALVYLLLYGSLKGEDLRQLRLVLFAGEVFPMKYLQQLAQLLPQAEMYNLFGPTETNVCTFYRVDRSILPRLARLPIGKPCDYAQVLVLNDQGLVMREPDGEGELCVRGPSVTPGYWADPGKTEEAFIPDPSRPNSPREIYRTGDLVRLLDDGNFEFLGRRDNQVKIRGYRVELGEIEAAAITHPDVREAAALFVNKADFGAQIKIVVTTYSGKALSAAMLRQHCATLVPQYMVPEIVEFREYLPQTPNGKIDRLRLRSESPAS